MIMTDGGSELTECAARVMDAEARLTSSGLEHGMRRLTTISTTPPADTAGLQSPRRADDQGLRPQAKRQAAEPSCDRVEHLVDQRAASIT